MKASIIFYKPFIFTFETELTYSMSDGRTGKTFFDGYQTFKGKMFDRYDLYPRFREVSKKGTMSNRVTPPLAYLDLSQSRNVNFILPPESVARTAGRLIRMEYDQKYRSKDTYVKEFARLSWSVGRITRFADSASVKDNEVTVTVMSDPDGKDIFRRDIRALPYDVQEKIIIALYDAGEGRKTEIS